MWFLILEKLVMATIAGICICFSLFFFSPPPPSMMDPEDSTETLQRDGERVQ